MQKRLGYRKSEISRQQVLEAAIQVLGRKGFASTSVQDIAEEAKLSKGAVHYHFASKDELIQCVLDQCCDALVSDARKIWETDTAPIDRIRRSMASLWESRRRRLEFRVLLDLMAQGLHDKALVPPVAAMLQQKRAEMLKEIRAVLEASGLRPKVDPEVFPHLVLGIIDGLAIHNHFDPLTPAAEVELFKALDLVFAAFFTF